MTREDIVGVALGALATAIFLLIQGTCILRTGSFLRWGRPTAGGPAVLSKSRRIAYAALSFVAGGAVLAVLASRAAQHHLTLSGALQSLAPVWQPLVLGLLVVGVGLRAMINPARALRTARYAHPDIDGHDPVAQRVARLIGLAGFVIGVIVLLVALS